jgi:Zn-dependent protease with chaperone function
MDFFQNQEDARRRTRRLVGLFVLSVAAIIVLLYMAAGFALQWEGGLLDWKLLGTVAAVTAGTIGLGSGYKILQLSGGGATLARELGGRAVDPDTRHPDERRLLNIVEEMSLASGIPVPEVWVMDDEEGINAFAAGHTPADAVVGVTRGCMRALSRDEMQGVIAHEFSHILNGDMRLNLRMIGVVHGLLVMAIIGRIVMRFAAQMRGSRDSKSGDPRLAILLIGVVLLGLGYLGVFFGKLIKAAISRQREFLADAAAVQFTRNPDSIGGALLKIGGYSYGSELKTPRSEEASHLMFSNAMGSALANALSTHPPLDQRIKAILPHWDGTWPEISLPEIEARRIRDVPVSAHLEGAMAGFMDIPDKVTAEQAMTALDRIGQPTPDEIDAAIHISSLIPPEMRGLIRDTEGAQAAVFGMLLSGDPAARAREEAALAGLVDDRTSSTAREIAGQIQHWHSARLIAMVDLALPSLRRLTAAEYGRFAHILTQLIAADGHMDLFEFMLQKIVRRHLDLHFRRTPPPKAEVGRIQDAAPEASAIISAFAALSGEPGSPGHGKALAAANRALAEHAIQWTPELTTVSLERVDEALDRFDRAVPMVKKQLIYLCANVVFADGQVSNHEAELLRAVGDTIGCPVPPYGPGTRSVGAAA